MSVLEEFRSQLADEPGRALEAGRKLLADSQDDATRARALLLVGTATYRCGRPGEAVGPLAEAYSLYTKLGSNGDAIETLLNLGRSERDVGKLGDAASRFREALTLARDTGDEESEAEALNLQAGVLGARGEYREALECLDLALKIAGRLGGMELQASILTNMGPLRRKLGDFPGALDALKAADEIIMITAPGTRTQAVNLTNLGYLYRELDDLAAAQDYFSRAREVGRQADDAMVEAVSLNSLASVHSRRKEWDKAASLYGEALEFSRKMDFRQYEIDNLDGLGQVYAAKGDHMQARQVHLEALAISREIDDREGEIDALLNLGRDWLAMSEVEEAIGVLEEGLQLAEAQGRKRSLIEAHELLAEAFERRGQEGKALRHYREFYRVERAVFNEESEDRVRRLMVQFDLERARSEAEAYRERTVIAQLAQVEAEAKVLERTRELEEAQLEIVTRLAIAAEYRDDETGEHTWRVGRSAAAIATELGWPDDEVKLISAAARLHDVGKIGIRDAVLLKPDKLDSKEYDLMRRHTMIGGRILSGGQSRLLRMAEEIAFAHHERWDGKGYPLGLAGDEIPLSARIVAVADVFDALSHTRPYKRPWPVKDALAEIRRCSGHQFDPHVVEACIKVFSEDGASSVTEAPRRQFEMSTFPIGGDLKERLDHLLTERTLELEKARREAEVAARRMQVMAFSDSLTGLGNRRAFETDLDAEVTRALRNGDRVAVLTIDLDDLKTINDREGHERGDELLRSFAAAVQLKLMGMGRVFRVGGDEFAALLMHAGISDANTALEQVREAISMLAESGFREVSASSGAAVLPDEAASVTDLLRLSDQRMYQDKMARKAEAANLSKRARSV